MKKYVLNVIGVLTLMLLSINVTAQYLDEAYYGFENAYDAAGDGSDMQFGWEVKNGNGFSQSSEFYYGEDPFKNRSLKIGSDNYATGLTDEWRIDCGNFKRDNSQPKITQTGDYVLSFQLYIPSGSTPINTIKIIYSDPKENFVDETTNAWVQSTFDISSVDIRDRWVKMKTTVSIDAIGDKPTQAKAKQMQIRVVQNYKPATGSGYIYIDDVKIEDPIDYDSEDFIMDSDYFGFEAGDGSWWIGKNDANPDLSQRTYATIQSDVAKTDLYSLRIHADDYTKLHNTLDLSVTSTTSNGGVMKWVSGKVYDISYKVMKSGTNHPSTVGTFLKAVNSIGYWNYNWEISEITSTDQWEEVSHTFLYLAEDSSDPDNKIVQPDGTTIKSELGFKIRKTSFPETGSGTVYIDDVMVTENTTPLIEITGTLVDFVTDEGTASDAQELVIQAANLISTLDISAPSGYELSETVDGTYSDVLNLTPSNGRVANKTIFVRLATTATPDDGNGTISFESTNAVTVTKAVKGTVNALPKITVVESLSKFNSVVGTASASQSYKVSAVGLTNDVTITAPAGFEVSEDDNTFDATVVLSPTDGEIAETTIYVRVTALAELGGLAGKLTHANAEATQVDVDIEGTVTAEAVPTITVVESLTSFATTEGTASASQSYKVSAVDLTTDLTITAPTGFEVSEDDNTFNATVVLSPTDGDIAETTIYVRVSASATAGDISGKLTHVNAEATQVDIDVDGTVSELLNPAISVEESLTSFTTTEGTASASQSYTVSAVDLTTDLTITAPTGFEVSEDDNTFNATVVLSPTDGDIAETTIYVRVSASAAAGDLTGKLTHVNAEATQKDIDVDGAVSELLNPEITVVESLTSFATNEGTASASQSYKVSAVDLTSDLTITAPTGFEVSDDDNTFGATVVLSPSNGDIAETTIYVRVSASAASGDLTGKLTHVNAEATDVDIDIEGTVTAEAVPTITVVESLTSFSTSEGTASASQSYKVSAVDLTTDLTITAPTGFEVSDDDNTFGATVVLSPTDGDIAETTIYVRVSASAASGDLTGKLTHVNAEATNVDVDVDGTVSVVLNPAISVVESLTSFATTEGTASASQSYQVSAVDLTTDLTITAPSGFEVSEDDNAFGATVVLSPTDGDIAVTTIYVRLSASAGSGNISDDITHANAEALDVDIAVDGVVDTPTNIPGVSPVEIKMYPNPATDYITIEGAKESMVVFYNMTGSVSKKIMITSELQTIHISDLARGLYIVKIEGRNIDKHLKLQVR